ncbi:unnamed protein product, partial [marine sediment metagenome]
MQNPKSRLKPKGGTLFLLIFCVWLLIGAGIQAEQNSLDLTNISDVAKKDIKYFPTTVWKNSKRTFLDRNNLALLLLAGGGSLALHNTDADKNLNQNYRNHQAFDGLPDRFFKTLGSPGFHLAAAGYWYLQSINSNDDLNKSK